MGAGEYFGGFEPAPGDLVIAADGGIDRLAQLGIEPDIIIGDFDSAKTTPSGGNVILLPREKDDTDTLAAVRYGLGDGFTDFGIWGGTGGRADHTAANIQTLAFLSKRGARGHLYGDRYKITAVTDGTVTIVNTGVRHVSVFSHSDVSRGVCISGLFYCLDNASITNTFPIGVSNRFTAPEASISVRDGTLIIYLQA
ncbi:MAG: thiamine diphosphokinase [Eubacteriales bacterium]|jgi:thiamine pyrophosphokinase|nr:thiamine diphosphokinase [Eubacteriales bacterium]